MLKIYVVRHGQDMDNVNKILNGRRDEPLTEKGIEQAHQVAEKIKAAGIHFDHVYSSPLQRASKTAEIITDTLGIGKPEILDTLIERDFGIMTGKPLHRIKELCSPDIIQADVICYFLNPAGAETFPQLIKRGATVLHTLQSKHQEGNILLATHGDIGKMIYAAYYGLAWKEVLLMFHFGNSEILELSSGSNPQDAQVSKPNNTMRNYSQ